MKNLFNKLAKVIFITGLLTFSVAARASIQNVKNGNADLVIKNVILPGDIASGMTMYISYTIENQGSDPAVSSTTRIYISSDPYFDANDVYAGLHGESELPANSSMDVGTGFYINSPFKGQYYILLKADDDNVISETNEQNNVVALPVAIGVYDLVADRLEWIPDSVYQGQEVGILGKAENMGSNMVRPIIFYSMVYFSKDTLLDAEDVPMTSLYYSHLAPGSSSDSYSSFDVPDVTDGDYYLLTYVDYDNSVNEVNETNNISYTPLRVRRLNYDLGIRNVHKVSQLIQTDDTVTIEYEIFNAGTTDAAYAGVNFMLSRDTILDYTDTYIGGDYVGDVKAGLFSGRSISFAIPANANGSYYLILSCQADGPEDNRENNSSYLDLNVEKVESDIEAADLIVTDSVIFAGAILDFSYKIINNSDFALGEMEFDYFLSKDSLLDAADLKIASDGGYGFSLSPHKEVVRSESFYLLPQSLEGDYYLFVKADAAQNYEEVNEENNTAWCKILVHNYALTFPDLIIKNVTYPRKVEIGTTYAVSFDQVNQGHSPAYYASANLFLSLDSIPDASDKLVFPATQYTYAAGERRRIESEIKIESSTAPGVYYLLFVSDYPGYISEGNETNNVVAVRVEVLPSKPADLVIENISFSPTLYIGYFYPLEFDQINKGEGIAETNNISLFFSKDTLLDAQDLYLSEAGGGGLAAGDTYHYSGYEWIDTSFAPGTYYYLFVSDYYNQVLESNESNNVSYAKVKVSYANVDFVAKSLKVKNTNPKVGDTLEISSIVKNNGKVASTNCTIEYYLSKDKNYSYDDVYLNGTYDVSSINPGKEVKSKVTASLPSDIAPGTYYVLLVVDNYNYLPETKETNNILAEKIKVHEAKTHECARLISGAEATESLLNVTVGPNPAADFIRLQLNNIEAGEKVTVHVTDLAGNVVYSSIFYSQEHIIPVSELAGGVYLVKIESNELAEIVRIVKP